MSKQQNALRLALEAFEVATTPLAKDRQEVLRAITALREALAEQPAQQEPVNQRAHEMALRQWAHWKQYALELQEKLVKYEGGTPMILNTSPPAQRKPLTNEEIDRMYVSCKYGSVRELARAIEAAHNIKENT